MRMIDNIQCWWCWWTNIKWLITNCLFNLMRQEQYSTVLSYSISDRMRRRRHLLIVVMWVHQTNLCTCLNVVHVNQILCSSNSSFDKYPKGIDFNSMFIYIFMRRTTACCVQLTLYRLIERLVRVDHQRTILLSSTVNQPWCKSNFLLIAARIYTFVFETAARVVIISFSLFIEAYF